MTAVVVAAAYTPPGVVATVFGSESAAENHIPSASPPKRRSNALDWAIPVPRPNSCAAGRGPLVSFLRSDTQGIRNGCFPTRDTAF